MNDKLKKYDTYPWSRIIPRWLLGIGEIGLSIYLAISFMKYLGLFFSAYWVFSLFVLLPLIRCTKCYYYGKRCNTGWGLLAGFAFPRGEQVYFQSGYALTFLLWPLRFLPVAIGLLNLLDGIKFLPDGLFGIYLAVVIIHRLYYRLLSCPVCHQQKSCPVYNPDLLASGQNSREPS
ncbi:MAG: hypothetical protein GY839_01545 [candidate division Zixibacteria bacterium]|nr:hypothetical protein [candidate division Zixibacteria bacterium]